MEVEDMPEIELSSDEEVEHWSTQKFSFTWMPQGSEEEVALIVLKRPPVTEKKIEEIEVLMFVTCLICYHMEGLQMTEEDEVSVCAEGEGWMAGAKEQWGFVKVPFLFSWKITHVSRSGFVYINFPRNISKQRVWPPS